MDHPSPLRYPGGKASVAPFLARTIEANGLIGATYIEPFAGGAGAALKLLFAESVATIYLNDKDGFVFNFWKSILDDTQEFIRLIESCRVNVKTWKAQREILRSPARYSKLEVGFATFFLNRCNHSGVLNGGPIGGLSQTGSYKIGVRFNKVELIRRIERIHLFRDRIHISKSDALVFMKWLVASKRADLRDALVYFDPPYLEKARRLYPMYFKLRDHVRLAEYLSKRKEFRWIVSYDDVTPIRKLYADPKRSVKKAYPLHSAKVGRELLIFGPTCIAPR